MSAISSADPRTGGPAASIASTTAQGVTEIVQRAAEAAPYVAAAPPSDRRAWLEAAAAALESHRDELARVADWETALGSVRLSGEVTRTANQARFYGEVAAEGSYLGAVIDHAQDAAPFIARVNEPLGVVAVFGASNFPFAFSVFGNDTASAIAAGCSVVVKAHPAHLGLSQMVFEIVEEAMFAAGAPEGVIEIVHGFEAGLSLVKHPDIAAVAFTGSEQGGMALWRAANERPDVIPVFAEMGTVNPVVVTPTAGLDMESIAQGFVGSFTLGNGQFCTKPGLILVPRGADGTQAIATAFERSAPDPVMLTEGIAEAVQRGVDELTQAGATIVAQASVRGDGWSAPASVLAAPIDALAPGSRLLEECFGAVAIVVEYDHLQDAIAAVGRLHGALAASAWIGGDIDADAVVVIDALRRKVGRVIVNDWPTGVAFTWAQQHGGPWPATTHPASTSVGAAALDRFVRPVAYQGVPDALLPPAVQAGNPWRVPRRIDGKVRLR